MAGKSRDQRRGMMLAAYRDILASVAVAGQPTPTDPPLTPEEIEQTAAWMGRTAAEVAAEREQGDG